MASKRAQFDGTISQLEKKSILLEKHTFGKISGNQIFSVIVKGGAMKRIFFSMVAILVLSSIIGCAGGDLSTREKGAGIGALGGAAVGGIIGAAVGHPGAGAAIGGALGLGTGALIGDQLQGQQNRQADQQRQIDANQAELDRQRRELDRIKKQGEY
jgi:hypothetical protein